MLQKQQRERQQRAAVDLKHHIDEAMTGIADKAEVHQTRAKQQAEAHAKEFNALLESGQNPYAVSARIPSAKTRHHCRAQSLRQDAHHDCKCMTAGLRKYMFGRASPQDMHKAVKT